MPPQYYGRNILTIPMPDNDSGENTIGGYLIAVLRQLWREAQDFDPNAPFGESSTAWWADLIHALDAAGCLDEGATVTTANDLIDLAILALG